MTERARLRVRRLCLYLALGIGLLAVIASVTGGFTWSLGSIRLLSLRHSRNPTVLAILLVGIWWRLAPRGARVPTLHGDLDAMALRPGIASALPTWIAVAATVIAVVVATLEGVFVVGGADSYGYASQAHLWAEGRIRVDEPLIAELAPVAPAEVAVPLGYHLTPDRLGVVPSFSPGFPMLMALHQRVAGREAVFAAVPLMAGLMVWATFLLGRMVAGAVVGAAAAVMLVASPTFILQSISPPMSDVPGAAWWTLSLALLGSGSVAAAGLSGAAAGWAVLTRPNLVPLAALPLVVLAWPILTTRTLDRRSLRRTLLYAAAVAAACAGIAAINWSANGSPLLSGYGPLPEYYAWANWRHNLDRYTTWLLETQTPLIALSVLAPVVLSARRAIPGLTLAPRVVIVVLSMFALGVGLSYLWYLRFDAWFHLRFLLPAYPILLVFTCAVLLAAASALPRVLAVLVFATTVGLLAWTGISEARARAVFSWDTERKYALVGRYVDRRLPPRGIVLSGQHSGNVRYYSGRKIVRWDLVEPLALDAVVARVIERGYDPYLLLESWEVEPFRQRFPAQRLLAVVDQPPIARLPLGDIRLYALAPRADGSAATPTETIPDP